MSVPPMTRFNTLDDFDFTGKKVLLRGDLNVPVRNGKVTNAQRLERLAGTVKELAAKGAAVVLISHFGRPKGKPVPEMSLAPVAQALGGVLNGIPVSFAPECVGAVAEQAVGGLAPGSVLVLENLRYHDGEEANDPGFAAQLAKLGDIYVDDAFSASHRAHASIDGVARLLPAAAGRLMEAEISALTKALDAPERPLVAVVGGNKISTKLALLTHLITKVDRLVIGGAMANTFLAAAGHDMGRSLSEPDMFSTAKDILAKAEDGGCTLILPSDGVAAAELKEGADAAIVTIDAFPKDEMMLDLGPASVAAIVAALKDCRSLVWNGPLGAFEFPPFDGATNAVARAAADLTKAGQLLSVAGGGDTVAALENAGVINRFSYVSTAGGAFLEWLEGRELPGIAVLRERADVR